MTGISVPIFAMDRAVACLSLVWIAAAFTEEEIVRRHLVSLKEAAQHIGQAVNDRLPRA
jgi:DNA-binding IclR family transcriptional regulator